MSDRTFFCFILSLLVLFEKQLVFAFNNLALAKNQTLYPFALGLIVVCLFAILLLKKRNGSLALFGDAKIPY